MRKRNQSGSGSQGLLYCVYKSHVLTSFLEGARGGKGGQSLWQNISRRGTGQSLREKSHFTGGETETEKESDLQELTQLLCGEVKTRTDTTL